MKQLESAPTHQIPPFKAAASIPVPCIATAVPTIHIPTQQQDGEPAPAGGTAAADGKTHHITSMISRAALYFCDVLALLSSLLCFQTQQEGAEHAAAEGAAAADAFHS
jgi:hypothetical protein